MVFHRTPNLDSHWCRQTSDSEMAASPTSTTPTSPATRASTRYFRCSAGMLLKQLRHAIRALGPTWSTTQAAPPTAHRAEPPQPPQRHRAEPPILARTTRTPLNRSPCPLPCEFPARGTVRTRTALLATRPEDQRAELTPRGFSPRAGKAFPDRTRSSNSARCPSRLE